MAKTGAAQGRSGQAATALVNRVAIYAPSMGDGGVERKLVNLASGLGAAGVAVDLLCTSALPQFLNPDALPGSVRVQIWEPHGFNESMFADWLDTESPDVLLAAKDQSCQTALAARALSRWNGPIVYSCGTDVIARGRERAFLPRWRQRRRTRALFESVDCVIGNSRGVYESVASVAPRCKKRALIRNPTVTPALRQAAGAEVEHPWLRNKEVPVVLAVGRLAAVKDYPTLLRAFREAQQDRPMRLLILGEGGQRAKLEHLVSRLGIESCVAMPGFCDNPYPLIAASDAVVLSSRREGMPTVLVEAMALGTPVVSTDCPSGPRELLNDGEFGPLVPVGDVAGLARAIGRILSQAVERPHLERAVNAYRQDVSVGHHLSLFVRLVAGRDSST